MSAPLFSVVIPTFNSGTKLADTLLSVSVHDRTLHETIVIDGGSMDGTPAWLRKQGPAVRWLSERDRGIYDAMNKGVALATGQFLLFLGAGDLLRPGTLAAVASRIAVTPAGRPRLFYGDVRRMDRGGAREGGRFSLARLCRANVCHQGIFYERSLFERFGGYELDYPVAADWAFNYRCFGDRSIRKVYLPMLIADFEGDGASCHQEDLRFRADNRRLIRERLGLYTAARAWLDPKILWRIDRLRRRLGWADRGATSMTS